MSPGQSTSSARTGVLPPLPETPTSSGKKISRPSLNIKRESEGDEVALKREPDTDTAPVSDADAQLLLGLHLSTPVQPTTPASSRVSIAALINAVDVPIPGRGRGTVPSSAPARSTTFPGNLSPPSCLARARSVSPSSTSARALKTALPPLIPPRPALDESPLTTMSILSQESNLANTRETVSMSISVEPEPQPTDEAAISFTAPPSTRTTTSSPIKTPGSGKPRGRVSKGPKKRKGRGWIIESCTTSGVPSENSSPPSPVLTPKHEDISREVFGGESDLTDPESNSDSGDIEGEYDPGLVGLPALPLSSESEYEPGSRGGVKEEIVQRSSRSNKGQKRGTGVNYQAFQASARPSVRIMSRTAREKRMDNDESNDDDADEGAAPIELGASSGSRLRGNLRRGSGRRLLSRAQHDLEAEKEDVKPDLGIKRGTMSVPGGNDSKGRPYRITIRHTAPTRPAPEARLQTAKRGRKRGGVVAAPPSATSSVSLGGRHGDSYSGLGPRQRAKMERAQRNAKASSKVNSGTSGSTNSNDNAASSPSLGGTRQFDEQISPPLDESQILDSPSLGGGMSLAARSDAGATHVSESVETHVSETTAGLVDEPEMETERQKIKGVDVRDFGYERTDADGSRTIKTILKVVLPPREGRSSLEDAQTVRPSSPRKTPARPNSRAEVSPTRAIATPAHLISTSPNKSPGRSQQVLLLVPSGTGQTSEWEQIEARVVDRSAYGRRMRDEDDSIALDLGFNEDGHRDTELAVEDRKKHSKRKQRGEPALKKMKIESGSASGWNKKGKGKATIEIDDELESVSDRRSQRRSKPTIRALESAQQKDWKLNDGANWVQTQNSRRPEKPTLAQASGSCGNGALERRARSGSVKRQWNDETGANNSKRPKMNFEPTTAPVPSAPMVQLHEGDFILRMQTKKCFHYNYEQTVVPRCVACRKKQMGDTCRFVGVRYFKLTPNTLDPIGVAFDSPTVKELPDYHLPLTWNILPNIDQIDLMQIVIARSLYPVLREELAHAQKPNVIWRPVEIEVRATCDVCATSVFASCHMCIHCGRELCGACYQQVEDMCPPGTPTQYNGGRKDQQMHKYRACGRNVFHVPAYFRPITRFTREELEDTVRDMANRIAKSAPAQTASASGTGRIVKWASRIPVWNPTSPQASTEPPALSSAGSSHDVSSLRGTPDPQLSSMPIIASPTMSPTHEDGFGPDAAAEPRKRPIASQHGRVDPAGIPTHPVNYFSKDITEGVFRPIWARGETVVVRGLLDEFQIQWTPQYFIDEHGEQNCLVVDCQNDKVSETTVEAFFSQFGKKDRADGVLKLKDWPAKADFRDDFPNLFNDFMHALPIPNYTRRDGFLNVASHFATNAIAPDLGPKMYNAFASSEGPGGQGSTRLHMDMADAVNIMMFANDSKDGLPGVAVWDIFRACDSDKIRDYLRRHFGHQSNQYRDPIHSQFFYLDTDHRRRLYEEEKVYSWRIYQRPGEAVFIPAGCAHQVCNLADCIKVAIDFVSLENIDRCEKLTAEFRNENDTFTWKEDVLQLRTMMMYAWRSTAQLRQTWDESPDFAEAQEP